MATNNISPPIVRPISIRVGGEIYFGHYTITVDRVMVTYGYRTKMKYLDEDDASSVEDLARSLLHELVIPT